MTFTDVVGTDVSAISKVNNVQLGEIHLPNSEKIEPLTHQLYRWLDGTTKVEGVTDIPQLRSSVGTTIGEVRKENQDRAVIARVIDSKNADQSLVIGVVCDGMGGMKDGGECAQIACTAFIDYLVSNPISWSNNASLNQAVHAANVAVFRRYRGTGGTTLVALVFSESGKICGTSAGDSRLYELTNNRKLIQLSVDDTIAGELQRLRGSNGVQTPLDSLNTRLAQYIGMGDGLDPRVYELDAKRPDTSYFLSTDGLQTIATSTLSDVLVSAHSTYAAVSRLLQLSRWCGGRDNASAAFIEVNLKTAFTRKHSGPNITVEVWSGFSSIKIVNILKKYDTVPVPVYRPIVDPFRRRTGTQNSARAPEDYSRGRVQKGRKERKKSKPDAKRSKQANRKLSAEIKVQILETSAKDHRP